MTKPISKRGLPAWALSVVLHATLLLVVAYLARFTPKGAGPADADDRTVGVALVRRNEGEREILTSEQAQMEAAQAAEQATQQALEALP